MPQTYIRFSSTVEDCIGAPYCMDEEDDKFLQSLNEEKGKGDGSKCTPDLFEEVLSFFEETALTRQPFAAIDNPPVLTLEELQASYDDTITSEARGWADSIYPHWQALRIEQGNQPAMSSLKMETGQETDDADAYVCFRRREVRQARKTRGRDAQVVDKLKKLRRELEDARELVHLINQREKLNSERTETERKVFEQRTELKRVKIQQGIKGDKGDDEELLVNQRVCCVHNDVVGCRADPLQPAPKPKQKADAGQQRPAMLRLSAGRPDARAPENDYVQLSEVQEEAVAAVQRQIDNKIAKHREWNQGFLDHTWNPITPPLEVPALSGYLPRVVEVQLPTPPASVGAEDTGDAEMKDAEDDSADLPTPVSDQEGTLSQTIFKFLSAVPESIKKACPSFRRRYGRNGRLHIEERWPRKALIASNSGVVYDSDGDSEEETVVYPVDYYDTWNMNYRASLLASRPRQDAGADHAGRRSSSAGDVAMANAGHTTGQQVPVNT